MALTRSRKSDRALRQDSGADSRRWWSLELLLMLAVTLLATIGAIHIYNVKSGQASGLGDELEADPCTAAAQKSSPTLLTDAGRADALLPALSVAFSEPADQRFAAKWLWKYLEADQAGPARLAHVGSLTAAKVPVKEIESNLDLVQFKRTLEARRTRGALPDEVPVLTLRQLQQVKPRLAVRTLETFRSRLLLALTLFLAGSWLPLLGWRVRGLRPDPWLLPAAMLLSSIGFILMVSLRDPLRDQLLFQDFAVGVLGGGIILLAVSLIDFQASPLRQLSFVPLLGALLTSILLVTLGSGPRGSDAKVNLVLGPVTLQPVEIVKLQIVLFLAGYFTRRWELLRSLRHQSEKLPGLFRRLELPRRQDALPVLIGMGVALAFLFIQRDLGPALVLGWTFLALYSVARGRGGLALAGTSILVIGCWAAYRLGFPATVFKRIVMWIDPWENMQKGGDQLAMGLWAAAAGRLAGAGLGWGETVRVPAAHTDFILGAVAEELGFLGLTAVLVAWALVLWRGFRIARRSEGDYPFFLGLGLTTLLGAQLFLIAAGILGVMPLSGVTTPLLSYGKSSQWSVYLAFGALAALSARPWTGAPDGSPEARFGAPVLKLAALGAVLLGVVLARAAWIQLIKPDEIMVKPILALQAEDEVGFVPNPRLKEIADRIPRGTVYDRNSIPLATTCGEGLEARKAELQALRVDVERVCRDPHRRCYPLGGATFHLLGDVREPVNWAASNTRYAEKEFSLQLQGFDDHPTVIDVHRPDGQSDREMRRDYRDLLPLWWSHRDPAPLQAVLNKDRRQFLTIDARLQVRVADILGKALRQAGLEKGAVVVLDPSSGAILASVSWPFPKELGSALGSLEPQAPELLDRARFGLYPPGSTFKIVTAMAALRKDAGLADITYDCVNLEDGRVGNQVKGERRPIRDDIMDKVPHGKVDLARGVQVSCNAYFAQLTVDGVGAQALLDTARIFGIDVARPNTVQELKKALAFAGYGQGEVTASPLELASVAATVAAHGMLFRPTLSLEEANSRATGASTGASSRASTGNPTSATSGASTGPTTGASPRPSTAPSPAPSTGIEVLNPTLADRLAADMRLVVSSGTGKVLNGSSLPIAGKTGTAELEHRPSHGWFIGYAPYIAPGTPSAGTRQIAFAVLAENGQYGAKVAAPVAGELVRAASELGLIP